MKVRPAKVDLPSALSKLTEKLDDLVMHRRGAAYDPRGDAVAAHAGDVLDTAVA